MPHYKKRKSDVGMTVSQSVPHKVLDHYVIFILSSTIVCMEKYLSLTQAVMIIGFAMSQSVVLVEANGAYTCATGSGKSTLCKLKKLVCNAQVQCGESEGPFWLSDDDHLKSWEVISY